MKYSKLILKELKKDLKTAKERREYLESFNYLLYIRPIDLMRESIHGQQEVLEYLRIRV